MANRRPSRKRKSPIGFLLTISLLLVGAAGFGYLISSRLIAPVEEPRRQVVQPEPPPARVKINQQHRKVQVYVLKVYDNDARLVPQTERVPAAADPRAAALERLIETNLKGDDSQYLIPEGTRLLGVHVKDGIAYADFSKEITENFAGGSSSEALLVNAIVHTLQQFKDVEKVQLLVEGKRIESLGGHYDVSVPISGDSTLLDEGDSE